MSWSVGLALIRTRVRFPGAGVNLGIFIGPHIRPEYLCSSQEAESREISICCKNLFLVRCKIDMFKQKFQFARLSYIRNVFGKLHPGVRIVLVCFQLPGRKAGRVLALTFNVQLYVSYRARPCSSKPYDEFCSMIIIYKVALQILE